MSSDAAAAGWRPLAGLAVAAACVCVVLASFHETVFAAVATWYGSATFGHCFFIAPISAYLVWRRRAELALLDPSPGFAGVAAVAVGSLVWLLGQITETTVVEELAVVAIIQGIVLAIFGWPTFRTVRFPLLYLYFAVPFGQALVPPLQAITADLAISMLRAVDIPVFVDGNVISVPSGTFYVAEACSGVRYLIASIALGALFAGIAYRSWWRRTIFLMASVVIPVLANGVRAFAIIFAAQLVGNDLAAGIDHVIYGWIFFALVTALILSVGFAFRDNVDAGATPKPRLRHAVDRGPSAQRIAVTAVLALLPVVTVTVYASRIDRAGTDRPIHLLLPHVGSRWQQLDRSGDVSDIDLATPDAEVYGTYGDHETHVQLQIGYYASLRRGAQAVSSAHEFDHAHRWTNAASGTTTAVVDGRPVVVQYLRMVNGRVGHLVWYWYWIDGRFTGSRYFAKLLEAKAKLLGGEQRAAIIVAATDYIDASEDGEHALQRFLDDVDDLSALLEDS